MKKTATLIFLFMFIVNGCISTLSEIDDTESRLLEILNKDVALGVEGFDSGG